LDEWVSSAGFEASTRGLIPTAAVPATAPNSVDMLYPLLGPDCALVVLFASPSTNIPSLLAKARRLWPESQIVGCTTAGEIAPNAGYVEDHILAVGFPKWHFAAHTIVMERLSGIDPQATIRQCMQARSEFAKAAPHFTNEFAFLLVDGLSRKEDHLAATLAAGLGAMPMFGGSAGDGTRFDESLVFFGGAQLTDAAVLTLVRTHCPVRVFSLNHFSPTETRMVVTRATPDQRLVHEINAEPAATELARLLNKPSGQLDTFTFAETPVVVRLGDTHHVRAIKRVTPDGDLEFFSAIDEGLVLSLAQSASMVNHLKGAFDDMSVTQKPAAILACDCVLRRIEADQNQLTTRLSAVLQDYGVAGFSTYGEQFGGMHVNQTMTGVAVYPPESATPDPRPRADASVAPHDG